MTFSFNPRKFGHWILDKTFYLSGYVSVFFVVALSVIDISDLSKETISFLGAEKFEIGKFIYWFSVICSIIFGIMSIYNTHETSKLEEEGNIKDSKIADLENSLNQVVEETNQLFNSYLKLLTKSLDFGHTERISVYKIYNNEFVRIGRTSDNPNFKNSGRKSYPISEGFIGLGWSIGEFFLSTLPDPLERNGNTYFNAINVISPIPRNIIDNLNMKSRTYYICRIDGFDSEPKAIFVAESLRPNAFTREIVLEKMDGIRQPLIMFIEKINNPNITTQQNLTSIGI